MTSGKKKKKKWEMHGRELAERCTPPVSLHQQRQIEREENQGQEGAVISVTPATLHDNSFPFQIAVLFCVVFHWRTAVEWWTNENTLFCDLHESLCRRHYVERERERSIKMQNVPFHLHSTTTLLAAHWYNQHFGWCEKITQQFLELVKKS